jgi:outer membrane lipoprotein carrier protein
MGFMGEELIVMQLSDKLGQTTRIEFNKVKRNVPLKAGLFEFKPPAGTDVIGTPRKP